MPKDYTDFVMVVFDAGDRVYHWHHLRHGKVYGKQVTIDNKLYPINGHKYLLALDRAVQDKWRPWSLVIKTKYEIEHKRKGKVEKRIKTLVRPWRTLLEIFRSKRIGILWYQEPCTNKCSGCKLREKDPDCCKKIPTVIEPMHISRIHQPSGEMRG